MKKLLLALLISGLFITCKKDNYSNLCGGSDPIKNLTWLKSQIIDYQSKKLVSVVRGKYKNQTYYYFNFYCCIACSCVPGPVFDCKGNKINFSGNQYEEVRSSIEFISSSQTIWRNETI